MMWDHGDTELKTCPRCHGRGRFIADEVRYLDPCEDDEGHEAWERCLDCYGTGEVEVARRLSPDRRRTVQDID
jgi:DnaJ-class molecular chaperone